MSAVTQLYQLQRVDSEWDERHGLLEEVMARLGESQELLQAREAVAGAEETLHELRSQSRGLELEIKSLDDKLKKNQDRLYSGKVRNPKELTGLQDEAFSLRRRKEELEDEQLLLLMEIEEQEAELAEREARLRQITAAWRQEQAALEVEKGELEQRLAELEAEREERRAGIGAADLELYDDLRRRYGGLAVVVVRRGICQTCGVDVPTSVARAVERGEGPYFCPVCNRLMSGG
jgi:predicted  nucleic acid-binding Zn-ribbon protein